MGSTLNEKSVPVLLHSGKMAVSGIFLVAWKSENSRQVSCRFFNSYTNERSLLKWQKI